MSAAENTATFAIDFDTKGAKAGADGAAGALEKLQAQIKEDTEALARMQKAMRDLQGGTSVNIQAFRNLKSQIEAKKNAIAGATANYTALGGAFKKTKKPVEDNTDAFKTLFERMQKGGGPLGGLAGRLQGLRALLAGGGALVVGAVAFVAALVAIAGAATLAAGALLKYGLAAADAYRSERLQLEGMTKVRNWYGITAGKAADLQSAIDNVSGSVSLGRDELIGLERSLYQVGFRGAALENALQGVATATDAAGDAQGAFAKQLYIAYGRTAEGAKKVSDDIKARFGGVVSAKMLSLTVQTKKLHENFQALFRGLNIESFLQALKNITDLFSQNTASGRALKQLLEIALQPLIDGFTEAGPLAKRFFQGAILAAQNLTIEYYNVRLWLKKTFGDVSILKGVDGLTLALTAGKIAAYAFAGGVALIALSIAIMAAPFVLLGYQIGKFVDSIYSAGKAIKAVDWTSLGSALIDGFVNGITNGIGRVVSAVKNVGKAALETLQHALDSHSPSRKGFALGITYPQGAAGGIEKGVPLVRKASENLGAAIEYGAQRKAPDANDTASALTPAIPPPARAQQAAGAVPANGGGMTLQLTVPVTVESGANADADELKEMIERVVEEKIVPAVHHMFENAHVSMGAPL